MQKCYLILWFTFTKHLKFNVTVHYILSYYAHCTSTVLFYYEPLGYMVSVGSCVKLELNLPGLETKKNWFIFSQCCLLLKKFLETRYLISFHSVLWLYYLAKTVREKTNISWTPVIYVRHWIKQLALNRYCFSKWQVNAVLGNEKVEL